MFIAPAKMTFKDVSAMKGNITIKYEPNSNADNNKNKFGYLFGCGLAYISTITTGDKTYQGPRKDGGTKVECIFSKDNVEKYISDLCANEKSISFDVK